MVAAVIGAVASALMWARLRSAGGYAFALDFSPHWRAADAMLHGVSPYLAINAFTTLYPFGAGYLYMLPAAIILLPFGYLEPQTATVIFAGISIAVFAYALARDGWWRLPLLASAPLVYGALSGQTVPLIVAAMLVPSLGWLAPIKFTLGAAGWVYNLSLRYALLAAAVVVVSVAVFPWWPMQWVHELGDVNGVYYHVPLRVLGGVVALAALSRWRRPEARLIAVMACVPQTMLFYDQLPLGLVAHTYRQALTFAVASWVAPLMSLWHFGSQPVDRQSLLAWNAPLIVACYYIPCALVVLTRGNAHEPSVIRCRERPSRDVATRAAVAQAPADLG